jgi:hypothetical protein
MKIINFFFFFLLVSISVQSQITEKDTVKMGYQLKESDTLLSEPIQLEEILILKEKLDPESKKQYLLLRNRVYKTYPYARIASERFLAINNTMNKLKTSKEKRKYFKIVEDYMENEFTEQLKKLSRKQGQILVKLIHRQTGFTTYELIKDYKSGWKAFWSNTTAKVFDINLKTPYSPYEVNEDYLIETILFRAFNSGRLIEQESKNPVIYDDLSDFWEQKALKKN